MIYLGCDSRKAIKQSVLVTSFEILDEVFSGGIRIDLTQVVINEDWSVQKLRKGTNIKTIKRDFKVLSNKDQSKVRTISQIEFSKGVLFISKSLGCVTNIYRLSLG